MKKIIGILKENLSENRINHSLGVARTAFYLASKHLPEKKEKAFLAGIIHDLAREWPEEKYLTYLKNKGYVILPEDLKLPVVLHAPAGAYYAEEILGITDEEILNAISLHTLGAVKMTKLEQIVFLADLIEPGRRFPAKNKILKECFLNLDRGMVLALENTVNYLKGENKLIDPRTILVLNYFREKVANNA